MEQTLDIQDIEVLDTGRSLPVSSENNAYAYLGGDFTTNPNDYVEVLVYDINNNFLESAVVDESDYISNVVTGLNLNTGTILRKLGYDRGRYVVKYNFFRKSAGSDETMLVNIDGNIYTGEPTIDSNGIIVDDKNNKLLVKENKYYIHEISDSRSEIRLVPEKINDFEYRDNFLKIQTERNYIKVEGGVKILSENGGALEDSKLLQFPNPLSKQIIGGVVSINNCFIEKIIKPPSAEKDEADGRTDELDDLTGVVNARFYVSDLSQANVRVANPDVYFTKFHARMKGVTTIQQLEDKYGAGTTPLPNGQTIPNNSIGFPTLFTIEDRNRGLEGIRNAIDDVLNPIELIYSGDKDNIITLTSITTRPLNLEAYYRWELSGYDRDTNNYDVINAGDRENNDVQWTTPFGGNSKVVEGVGVTEATFAISSKDTHVGVRLTVSMADVDGSPSTIMYPVCFETDEDR